MRPRLNARRSLALVVTVVWISTLVATSRAGATTQSVSSRGLTATLTYAGSYPRARDPHLTIRRADLVLYRGAVRSRWCGATCWPNLVVPGAKVLHVVQLEPRGPTDVVLDLWSGGAHCCTIEQVYYPVARGYRMVEHEFGDAASRLVPMGTGGGIDFVSADDSFAYAFTDYAASGMPIEILAFSNGHFRDVTRSFPALIGRDATQWRRAFNAAAVNNYADTVGLVAAWAADEEMLGRPALVQRFLADQERAGHLNSALSPVDPGGSRFVVALERFLRRHHYTTGHGHPLG